jgi:glycosyltransferase involved in cell wall biosynthesis
MRLPQYTVIISVYDKVGIEVLKESIDSIINQSYKPENIIIIKDGILTEHQEKLINTYLKDFQRLITIMEFSENMGTGFVYKEAIMKCKTEYVAIMDSDDYVIPTKFEKQVKFLQEHPEVDILGSNAVEFLDRIDNVISTRIMPESNEEIIKFARKRCPLIQPTAIFKKESVIKAGNYQSARIAEDYDLYIRMIQNGCKFHNLQEVLCYVRTNKEFFKRRGGIKYAIIIMKFKYKHYKNGFFTLKDFIITGGASMVVSLLPNFIRESIYKKFLRKTN